MVVHQGGQLRDYFRVLFSDVELLRRIDVQVEQQRFGMLLGELETRWRSRLARFALLLAVACELTGMVLEPAVKYQDIARQRGLPRHNH